MARLCFPEHERRQPWLMAMLAGHAGIDAGVQKAIKRQTDQGSSLACIKGRSACCRCHLDIPVYPLGLTGIYRYVIEQLDGPTRRRTKQSGQHRFSQVLQQQDWTKLAARMGQQAAQQQQ